MRNLIIRAVFVSFIAVALFSFQACLTIIAFNAPTSASSGQVITTMVRVKSDSGDETPTVKYFFSTDRFLDAEDIPLHEQSYFLPENALFGDFAAQFQLPSNFHSGTYFLIALVQDSPDGRNIYQNGENVLFHKFTLNNNDDSNFDLFLSNVHVNDLVFDYYQRESYFPGQSVTIYTSVHNRGMAASGVQIIRFYLSPNAIYSSSDPDMQLLGQELVLQIPANGRVEIKGQFSMPVPNSLGLNYVHIVADGTETNTESNENNNVATRLIDINERREDHYLQNLEAPGLILADQEFRLSFEEGITGRLGNYFAQNGIFLSRDKTLSADDVMLQSSTYNSSANISLREVERTITIPSIVSSGVYYIIASTNFSRDIPEYDFGNNEVAIRTFVVSPHSNSNGDESYCMEVFDLLSSESEIDLPEQQTKQGSGKGATTEVQVYPNPATDRVQVALELKDPSNELYGELMDANGKKVYYWSGSDLPAGQWSKTLDLSNLPAGTYFLRLISHDRDETRKLIVR